MLKRLEFSATSTPSEVGHAPVHPIDRYTTHTTSNELTLRPCAPAPLFKLTMSSLESSFPLNSYQPLVFLPIHAPPATLSPPPNHDWPCTAYQPTERFSVLCVLVLYIFTPAASSAQGAATRLWQVAENLPDAKVGQNI